MAKKELKFFLENTEVPETFGVYKFYDESEVIYVGKSVNLRRRLHEYLSPSRKKKYRKRRSIVSQISRVEFEVCEDEKSSLLLENCLIQELKPKMNTAGAYSFLYPVIAAKYSDHRLALVRTTLPDEFVEFQLYGAFRDRHLVNEMFESLVHLLSIIGNKEPAQRLQDIPKVKYTKRVAIREISAKFWNLLDPFLRGESSEFLPYLCEHLLSFPSAVAQSKAVEVHLQVLKSFYTCESRGVHEACQSLGLKGGYVEQSKRDALFIECK